MNAAAALSIRGMRVEYPLEDGRILAAVDGLDLEIAQGEIHALVGESGAGKTTVGNALMGLLDVEGIVAAGVDPGARAETLAPARFAALASQWVTRRGDAPGVIPAE